jgi:hypothetical protein
MIFHIPHFLAVKSLAYTEAKAIKAYARHFYGAAQHEISSYLYGGK